MTAVPGSSVRTLRLLFIATREPSWVNLCLQLEAGNDIDLRCDWVTEPAAAMSLLRAGSFACVLIATDECDNRPRELHRNRPGRRLWFFGRSKPSQRPRFFTDAVAITPVTSTRFCEAVRSSGDDTPILVLTSRPVDEFSVNLPGDHCIEVLVSNSGWDSQALVPALRRLLSRTEDSSDREQLLAGQRRRTALDRSEVDRILEQQLVIAGRDGGMFTVTAPTADNGNTADTGNVPPGVSAEYEALLRSFVVMGSGRMATEVQAIALWLRQRRFTARQVLAFHLLHVRRLISQLGSRSTRHVLTRSNLLILELLTCLDDLKP